jgi:hypothetical protein
MLLRPLGSHWTRSGGRPVKRSRCVAPRPAGFPSPVGEKALEQALPEAMRLRDNKITAEHVLLGILRNEQGQAVRLLAGMGIPVREVEERLDQLRSRSPLR